MKQILTFGLALVALAGCARTPPATDAEPSGDAAPSAVVVTSAATTVSAAAPTGSVTGTNGASTTSLDRKLLIGTWVHSSEEGAVYRPANYKAEWPQSRFRGRFTLSEDGSCSWAVLAPDDAHFSAKGAWKLEADGTLVLTATETVSWMKAGTVRTLKLASLTKDKLVLTNDSPYMHHAK